jgi:hypothetical protein
MEGVTTIGDRLSCLCKVPTFAQRPRTSRIAPLFLSPRDSLHVGRARWAVTNRHAGWPSADRRATLSHLRHRRWAKPIHKPLPVQHSRYRRVVRARGNTLVARWYSGVATCVSVEQVIQAIRRNELAPQPPRNAWAGWKVIVTLF